MTVKNILDPEVLKNQTNLTPAQEEALQKEIAAEFEEDDLSAEERSRKREEEEEEEDDQDEKDSGSNDEEETREEKEEKEETEEEEGAEKDAEKERLEQIRLGEEALKKEESTRTEEEKAAIQVFETARDEDRTKRAEALAQADGLKLEDAKKEIEAFDRIAEKYEKNPEKMAKALLHSAREYTRLKKEYEAVKDQPVIEDGEMVINGKVYSAEAAREKLIEAYRDKEPELTEGLDDEVVHKKALVQLAKDRKAFQAKLEEEQREKAVERRSEFLKDLPEESKKFAPDLKQMLDQLPDQMVLADSFSVQPLLWASKGKRYDADLKAAMEREYKRGLEDRKIIEDRSKAPVGGGSPKSKSGDGKKGSWASLTPAQKEEALNMFQGDYSDDERAKEYLEVMAHEQSLDKKKK